MKKTLVSFALLTALLVPGVQAADYGLPSGIQQGNILHCFNWPISEVKAMLPQIAAAGFGSIQMSPMQRADVHVGSPWHDLYRPYDLDFKGGLGSEAELQALCSEAANYGIKIIVDVVANHVDKTAGYHDPWWDSNGRVRWEGGINYGDRNSITHGQLGDYGDINSEDPEVCARGKSYVQKLASLGVKGIRWDAAKHIGLPSEGCNFWKEVTSVSGMYHYGEILDNPGPNASIIKEYGQYMSVTDNQYCNYAARDNGGIPGGYGGSWAVDYKMGDKCVYWAESHDTYANDDWSCNRDQAVIDRAYAAYACRNDATALYLSRPNAKGFNNIKVGKGSTHFTEPQVAEVNKFRNAMVGKADYFTSTGNAVSITRKDGGAVIVMKGSGNISIANGGGYCPAGEYTDKVSGGKFTVTASTISGNVGQSGIAVIYNGGDGPTPPTPPVGDAVTIAGDYNLAYSGTKSKVYYWKKGSDGGAKWPGVDMATATGSDGKTYKVYKVPEGTTNVIFNNGGDDSKTADLEYSSQYVMTDNGPGTTKVTFGGDGPTPPTPPADGDLWILGSLTTGGWSTTPGTGCAMTKSGDVYTAKNVSFTAASDETKCYFNLTDKVGATWDALNQEANRYGAATEGEAANIGGTNTIKKYALNVDASGCLSWTVDPGTYDITADLASMTLKVIKSGDQPTPEKPVVTATPGTSSFNGSVTVTLSVTPAGSKIYYTDNGSTPTTSSAEYVTSLTFTKTTTLKTLAVNGDQTNVQEFTYTLTDDPTPPVPPTPGNNLVTDYYKVNHKGFGTERTVNVSGHPASSALTNWGPNDMIAQGVARDVCQAFKGLHERPIVDSYAIYASYDNDNLYLGVQFVYTVWDLGGEGKQPGESKPYNMDGHMLWAFDLDPNKSFDGYIAGTGPIWNEKQKGAKFDNGVDAVLMCSTKPGTGTPGLFFPTPDGHASYDAAYCKSLPTNFYGYTDGLLSSIDKIWGLPFGSEPEALTGNVGFVDLKGEIAESAHTFYEFKIPLSLLGITKDYIKNTGIGVMYCDKYGTSPVGGTPYDPSYFDNVKDEYSYGDNTSKEKEDEDIITYSPARVGRGGATAVDGIMVDMNAPVEYYNLQGIRVMDIEAPGIYLKRQGNKTEKVIVR